MGTNPLVSIIVPVYNCEEYVGDCIRSLVNQTYQNIEIILINDGSTDNSLQICQDAAASDSRIILINKQQNGGASFARNVGLDIAKGEYISFADSDDTACKDYIYHLVRLVLKHNVQVAITGITLTKSAVLIDKENETSSEVLFSPINAVKTLFYQELFDSTSPCKIFHRSLFTDTRYKEGIIFEDLALMHILFLKSNGVVFSDIPSYNYLLRDNSVEGSSFSQKKYDSMVYVISLFRSDKRLEPIKDAVDCRLFSLILRIFYDMPSDHPKRSELWQEMKKLRLGVLLNPNARKKARAAAVLTYFGANFSNIIYKKIKTR